MKKNGRIKNGGVWKDKKTGDVMITQRRHHDLYWNCVFQRSFKSHKMTEFVIKKFYVPVVYDETTATS